jgi:GAF domain-containing protein
MDNMGREMWLLQQGSHSAGRSLPDAVARLVEAVTVDFAEARAAIKHQALAAAARGEVVTNLELVLPADAADAGERYLAALDEADRYARSARLLTLAAPTAHRVFRCWYVRSLTEQLRAAARGQRPPEPEPIAAVFGDEVDRLSQLENAALRLELLQRTNTALAAQTGAENMAAVVVSAAADYVGVESARVYLVTDHGTLRSAAWYSSEPTDPDLYAEIPLDADLPGAEVARSRQPIVMRSLREVYARFPQMEGYYPHERSLHIVPVATTEHALGVLGIAFKGGELGQETELQFVNALASALAQALERGHLARSDREANETISFLSDATHIMVSARDPSEVLDRLVRLAVPRLGDWCTVYLADSGALRRVAMAIDAFPELTEKLLSQPMLLDVDNPHTRAFHTGRPQPIASGVGQVLTRIYPDIDFASLGGDETSSGLVVPISLREEIIAIIALAFLGSGRRFTPRVEDTLAGLASRTAIALDNARNWAAQGQQMQSLVGVLLPPLPPDVPGFEFAARYLPAGGDVAGDWWEADPLADGSVLVGLGDAAGHGVDAVSLMLELRHGARALGAVETSPAALLSDLNRRLAGIDSGFATAIYGRLTPSSGRLRWASAGHVPPLLIRPDGNAHTLRQTPGPPLGTPRTRPDTDLELTLSPGETLVLYSDGVVERRNDSLDQGIARLAETATSHARADVNQLADAIVNDHCNHPVDDCCLLLIRRHRPA